MAKSTTALGVILGVALLFGGEAKANFLQTDPVGYKDNPDLYTYVGDDPVNRSDPTGLAGCGATSSGDRVALTGAQCQDWQQKQEQGKRDVASTRAGEAAWRKDPNSAAGRAFARAMTATFGKGALSPQNLTKLDRALGFLQKFYDDPGTAKGGQYDVYRVPGWSSGGTIVRGQVAFGSGYFTSNNSFNRVSTTHEPLHLSSGFGDRVAMFPNYGPGEVETPRVDEWYAGQNAAGAQSNADNWGCLIAQQCH